MSGPPPDKPQPSAADTATRVDRAAVPASSGDERPDPAPPVPADPPRLEIPSIGVRAHAIPLGTDADNKLEVPTNWSEVGWWKGGAKPGADGSAVIVGHVDSKTGPAVFHRLGELRSGDEVRFVRRDGSKVSFVVERKESHPKKQFPTKAVYEDTGSSSLRLITCDGDFDWKSGHYRSNLIVFARKA
jgi:LPXTG-site transpeptidase (sortase) family protein